jgi:Xaa-Pro aminopeptidase
MLNNAKFLKKFERIQHIVVSVTDDLLLKIKPGMSEKDVADLYRNMLQGVGLHNHWYPILIYAGEWTGKSITRRVHLPSKEVVIQNPDIVFLDSTPIDKTVWGNWCRTFTVGSNEFFQKLCNDCDEIVDQTYDYSKKNARFIGDIFDYCMDLIKNKGLTLLDSMNDVGHSIFQVPDGQRVEETPIEDRLFIDKKSRKVKLRGIISIEPQIGRVNPKDGKMYGAKQQKVIIFN